MKGVMFFLYDKGHTNPIEAHKIIKAFCEFAGIIITIEKPIINACVEIQKSFIVFLTWYNERHK